MGAIAPNMPKHPPHSPKSAPVGDHQFVEDAAEIVVADIECALGFTEDGVGCNPCFTDMGSGSGWLGVARPPRAKRETRGRSIGLQAYTRFSSVGTRTLCGNFLGILGGSLEKRIIGTDLTDDVMPVSTLQSTRSSSGWHRETIATQSWRRHERASVQQQLYEHCDSGSLQRKLECAR